MEIEDRIKQATDKIIADYQGDTYLIARYAARMRLLLIGDQDEKDLGFHQASDRQCEVCGAVPCGMGCHDDEE